MKTYRVEYSSSALDLLEDGPLIEVELTAPLQRVKYLRENGLPPFAILRGYALIDSGADRSAVDEEAMSALEIPPVGSEPFLTTHGIAELNLYNLGAVLPALDTGLMALRESPGGLVRNRMISGLHVVMLLGRDLLQNFVFSYDGPSGVTTLQL